MGASSGQERVSTPRYSNQWGCCCVRVRVSGAVMVRCLGMMLVIRFPISPKQMEGRARIIRA